MMTRKRRIFSLSVAIALALVGCGDAGKEIAVEKSDVVCINRPDLKLVVATMKRDLGTIDAAIQEGANVNTTIEGLGPPIVIAALTDHYEAVKLLLNKGADINSSDSQGYTALINASLNNNRNIVNLLVSRGVDVNAAAYPIINGKKVKLTALVIAKSKGNDEIVKVLTEAGANE